MPELAHGELLGSLNVRHPLSIVFREQHFFVTTLVVTYLPQSSSNFVRMLV
jgi:hypothetical protein